LTVRDEQPAQGDLRSRLRRWWIERRNAAANGISFCGIPVTARDPHVRAMRLLNKKLSDAQRDQYERCGYFEVMGGTTGNRYRIRTGNQMNVEQLDKNGRPVSLLCFMPEGCLPIGDTMLAQKFVLELFEGDALRTANRMHARRFHISFG
jgi:hypothetical protein